jgi:MFS family permease
VLLKSLAAARCTLALSAVDSITPALEHTKQQLFRPFRLGQWTKLAFVGLLAGELGANGFSRSNFQPPVHPGVGPHLPALGSLGIDHFLLAGMIVAAVVAAFAVGIILLYVGSVMRFILFDSVLSKECHIRWEWSRRLSAGWRYFAWKLGYVLLTVAGAIVLVGIPTGIALANGWFHQPKEHLPAFIAFGAVLFLVFAAFFLVTAVVLVLTKDFVIPQMALEDIDVTEGWRRLWAMMKPEQGAYVAYVVMKIVLAFVVAILTGVATMILGLVIAIPSAALGILAFLTGKSEGMTWNPQTIALAVIVVGLLLAAFFYLVSLIYVPAIVFFPAYSIYLFAGRYPRLGSVLNELQAPQRVVPIAR